MALLKSKPRVSIEDCCRDFYDSQIFKTGNPDAADMDSWSYFLAQCKASIAEDDETFLLVDSDSFWHEMTALHMAIFGQAFTIRVKLKLEDMVREVCFTRHYLEHKGRKDLWDTLLVYNDVIDHSAFMNKAGQSAEKASAWQRGKLAFLIEPRDTNMDSGRARARIAFMNNYRFRLFDKWTRVNIGYGQSPTNEEKERMKCLAIALKRVGADTERAGCVAIKLLATTLVERLAVVNLKEKALFNLGSVIFGFHARARSYLKSVSLQ
jgi:hypothetical protein